MCQPILLQDWLTIHGKFRSTIVPQQEASYADLIDYFELAVYVQATDFIGSPVLEIQTSPTREEAFFRTMASYTVTSVGLQTIAVVRYASAAIPLTRWVRWRLAPALDVYRLTFRVWLVGNPGHTGLPRDGLLAEASDQIPLRVRAALDLPLTLTAAAGLADPPTAVDGTKLHTAHIHHRSPRRGADERRLRNRG